MWAFRRHFPQDCTIISIQAPIKDPIGGNSWWLIDNQKPLKNNAQKAAKILDTYITKLLEYYALTPSQIFACGFSQGAATIASLAQLQKRKFNACILLAGFVPELSTSIENEQDISLPPFLIGHGSKDEVVTLERAKRGAHYLEENGSKVTFVTDEVGHKVGPKTLKTLKNWLEQQR